jgi:hypothetical protein
MRCCFIARVRVAAVVRVAAASTTHGQPTPTTATCVSPSTSLMVDCGGGGGDNVTLLTGVARAATSGASSPQPVWVGVVTGVTGATALRYSTSSAVGAAWSATALVAVRSGVTAVATTAVATAMSYSGPHPVTTAATLLLRWWGNDAAVAAAATAWWSDFWGRSQLRVPALPDIEALWVGGQYVLGCTASTDAATPPPGLYGVWTSSDDAGWNGDYTLDYNFESTYFGAFAANHAAQFASYAGPLLAWAPAGRKQAAQQAATAGVTCADAALHFACHLAPWGFQSDDLTIYMHWNLNFALLPLVSQWEYTRNATAAAAVLPLFDGAMQWWSCFLGNASDGTLVDVNAGNPDAEHEGQLVPNPQIGLALVMRSALAHVDMCAALGLPTPADSVRIATRLAAFNTATHVMRPPAPPAGNASYTTAQNYRCRGDFRMGSEASVAACEAACDADAACTCFTWCPGPATDGCPLGPSCWFFRDNSTCGPFPGFVAGWQQGGVNVTVWTAFEGASPSQSDTFSFYPNFPAEALGGLTPLSDGDRAIAQASSALYTDFVNGGRPLDVFTAAVLALSGGGALSPSSVALSELDIVGGIAAYMRAYFGSNQLARAPGGGVENAGISRAVADLVCGSAVLVPTISDDGAVAVAQWYVRVFPVWPANVSAAFSGFVAKGGVVVSAAFDGAAGVVASPVNVTATFAVDADAAAVNCTVRHPWYSADVAAAASVAVLCGGDKVDPVWLTVMEGGVAVPAVSFKAPMLQLCQLVQV